MKRGPLDHLIVRRNKGFGADTAELAADCRAGHTGATVP